jgi:hypothetical protein
LHAWPIFRYIRSLIDCRDKRYICPEFMTGTAAPKSRKLHATLLITLLVAFIVVYNRKFILGQFDSSSKRPVLVTTKSQAAKIWNRAQMDSALSLASDGDLVVRNGNDEVSDIFRRLNTHDPSFSHIGIVFWENGTPMVYNIIGGKDNPGGYLRRDSLQSFISPRYNFAFGIYRIPFTRQQKTQLYDNVLRYFEEKRKFDVQFSLETDSLLYCTEFVYKVVSETLNKDDYFETTHNEVLNFNYVAVDNLIRQPKNKMICRVRYKQ